MRRNSKKHENTGETRFADIITDALMAGCARVPIQPGWADREGKRQQALDMRGKGAPKEKKAGSK